MYSSFSSHLPSFYLVMYFSDSIRPWFRLHPVVGPLRFSPFCNSTLYDGILRCSVCLHSGNRRPWLPHYGWFVRIYILASWRRWSSIDCLLHPGMAKTSACVELPSRTVHFLVPVSLTVWNADCRLPLNIVSSWEDLISFSYTTLSFADIWVRH